MQNGFRVRPLPRYRRKFRRMSRRLSECLERQGYLTILRCEEVDGKIVNVEFLEDQGGMAPTRVGEVFPADYFVRTDRQEGVFQSGDRVNLPPELMPACTRRFPDLAVVLERQGYLTIAFCFDHAGRLAYVSFRETGENRVVCPDGLELVK